MLPATGSCGLTTREFFPWRGPRTRGQPTLPFPFTLDITTRTLLFSSAVTTPTILLHQTDYLVLLALVALNPLLVLPGTYWVLEILIVHRHQALLSTGVNWFNTRRTLRCTVNYNGIVLGHLTHWVCTGMFLVPRLWPRHSLPVTISLFPNLTLPLCTSPLNTLSSGLTIQYLLGICMN